MGFSPPQGQEWKAREGGRESASQPASPALAPGVRHSALPFASLHSISHAVSFSISSLQYFMGALSLQVATMPGSAKSRSAAAAAADYLTGTLLL